jgi:hypothetical protein
MATKQADKAKDKNVTTHEVDTKMTRTGSATRTELDLDWTGVTDEQCREWAARTVIINVQRVFRDSGTIPPKAHFLVTDFMSGKGRPARVMTPEKILAQAPKIAEDPKVAEALIKQLQESLKANKSAGKAKH